MQWVVIFLIISTIFFLKLKSCKQEKEMKKEITDMQITPIEHATMMLGWDGKIIYTDPVGGSEVFAENQEPDLILITDIHGDHLDIETLRAVAKQKTVLVVSGAVSEKLPPNLPGTVIILSNGEKTEQVGFSIEAIPMHNVPESEKSFHVKGRGNGYVIEKRGKRVYVAGDTGNTSEMRSLKNVDLAFVPMNIPYTMTVEDVARAVLAFNPEKIFPYHYRGPGGLSDINKFKTLVENANTNIEVVLLDWYPKN